MAETYVVTADACYIVPKVGTAWLAYKGASFPSDAQNLDDVLTRGLIAVVPSDFVVGGVPADRPDQDVVSDEPVVNDSTSRRTVTRK